LGETFWFERFFLVFFNNCKITEFNGLRYVFFNNCKITEFNGLRYQKIQKTELTPEAKTNKIQKLNIIAVLINGFYKNCLMH